MNDAGIDTGYKRLDVVIRNKGKSLKCQSYPNTSSGHSTLLAYLRKYNVKRVGIEATGYYHLDIAAELDNATDMEVMVINPHASKNFAKALMISIKNDAIDAEIIAQFIERMDFVPWNSPDYDVFALRACGRRLITLSKEKTKAKNQLHVAGVTSRTPCFIIDDIKLSIKQLEDQISNLIDNALLIIEQNTNLTSQYNLLTNMKGVVSKTTIKLLGELGVLDPAMVGKQWVSHAGLFPREFQSGSSVNKKTTIGKTGNRYIREALYMAALSASRHDPNIRAFYCHLVKGNGLTKLQAVCAVMRKMLVAMHGMLKNNRPFDGSRFYALDH